MIWNSYKQSLSKLSNKEKGDSFERLTKQYLTYDPKYATKLKHVWLLSEVPSSIHKKLNLPDQDQGIDLICETNEGEIRRTSFEKPASAKSYRVWVTQR